MCEYIFFLMNRERQTDKGQTVKYNKNMEEIWIFCAQTGRFLFSPIFSLFVLDVYFDWFDWIHLLIRLRQAKLDIQKWQRFAFSSVKPWKVFYISSNR